MLVASSRTHAPHYSNPLAIAMLLGGRTFFDDPWRVIEARAENGVGHDQVNLAEKQAQADLARKRMADLS